MYQKIEKIQKGIQAFVDKTSYVISIIHWASESLRKVSDILATFPKPPIREKENNIPEPERENSGAAQQQSGQPSDIPVGVAGENQSESGSEVRTVRNDGTGGAGTDEKQPHVVRTGL